MPDVEYAKKYVERTSKNRVIQKTDFHKADRLLKTTSAQKVAKELKGAKVKKASRHGKFLFIELDSGHDLFLHLGMTGTLEAHRENEGEHKHARLVMHLDLEKRLDFLNQRLLGEIGIAENREEFIRKKELGPDALAIAEKEFVGTFKEKSGGVKSALMDQKSMAGLGNIYSDEVLFQAKIHPMAKCADLSEKDWSRIYKVMKDVLNKAVKTAPKFGKLHDWLLNHRKAGEACPRCKGQVKMAKAGGRSSYFCPTCQKK